VVSAGVAGIWAVLRGLAPRMHAAAEPPPGLSGFSPAPAGVQIWFRGAGRLRPDVLEIGLRGRCRPKLAAYWDGCPMAMV